ncbi:MAG: glycosyltransferase [Candidatus Hydrogenedentota bacterium]
MKLLCICSALDLGYRYGCTPAWWQFFKGLYELGHDVIAVPYQGKAIETPWWRVYPNPCELEGKIYSFFRQRVGDTQGGVGGVSRTLIESWVQPRWENRLNEIFEKEKQVDAVILFTAPLNHFSGMPTRLRDRWNVPIFYFDGDVPASLPEFGGFASGFKIYEDADLSEYDGFLCNSVGGAEKLQEMGAKLVETVHWGVDPALCAPLAVEYERDVFFYGFGQEYRETWMDAMLFEPSRRMPGHSFELGGAGFGPELGNTRAVGDVPFNVFRRFCCSSRINLNITRQAHATVFASSSMRPFELAAMGCCIVSNPYAGLETWFDIGTDLEVVETTEEAVDVYTSLLNDEGTRKAMGEHARKRVLEEHTHRRRAEQIARFVKSV